MNAKLLNMKNKLVRSLRENGPEILVVGGVVGLVAACVKGCVDTHKKLPQALEKTEALVEQAHKEEDEEAEKKALTKAYICSGLEMAKVYAPTFLIGTTSIVAIFYGNNVLRKRIVALAAAYATLDASFKEYRRQVVERFGEEVDDQLQHGLHMEEIEVHRTDENGEEQTKKETVAVAGGKASGYARYFVKGESNEAYDDENYNGTFLRCQESSANLIFRRNGIMFLNEVYEMLGFKPTVAGQSVGWIYDPDDLSRANAISFDIRQVYRHDPDNRSHMEKVYLVDFNVDGNIIASAVDVGLMEADN